MHSLFNKTDLNDILDRIEKLTPGSSGNWGKMNVSQMLAHCNISLETAMGLNVIKRVLIGRILGPLVKPRALNEKPFSKNSPTDKSYIFPANLKFAEEKSKIVENIKKFGAGGPSQATTHPHPFFGKFTPEQWGVFQWKHMDHHLRQFGV
jgi:hypothetical protein